jgi:hypothetical protein
VGKRGMRDPRTRGKEVEYFWGGGKRNGMESEALNLRVFWPEAANYITSPIGLVLCCSVS